MAKRSLYYLWYVGTVCKYVSLRSSSFLKVVAGESLAAHALHKFALILTALRVKKPTLYSVHLINGFLRFEFPIYLMTANENQLYLPDISERQKNINKIRLRV
jgi:hypothetical protein